MHVKCKQKHNFVENGWNVKCKQKHDFDKVRIPAPTSSFTVAFLFRCCCPPP